MPPFSALSSNRRALLALACVPGLVLAGLAARDLPARQPAQAAPDGSLRLQAQPGVSPRTIATIRRDLLALRPRIDADFGVHGHPLLRVYLYASAPAFARALHQTEGVWPQSETDTSGNIIHGVLPLGPPNAYLRHNLAHIYAEWVLDRLTHNRGDRQPTPAWLYDGIAEWEAARRTAPLPCHLTDAYLLPLSSLTTAQQWWRIRGGIYGGLAYCEAQNAASRLIAHVGWPETRRLLHESQSWAAFARALKEAVHRGHIKS